MQVPLQRGVPVFSEEELWERYAGVTKELLKLINQQDIDVFLTLVDQRQVLLERIQAIPEEERVFGKTPECQQLRDEIKPMDMEIIFKARTWLNKSRRQTTQVQGYEMNNQSGVGQNLDKKIKFFI